jgi:hypothetical protein
MPETSPPPDQVRGASRIPNLDRVSIRPLAVASVFDQLDHDQKLYAHHLSK